MPHYTTIERSQPLNALEGMPDCKTAQHTTVQGSALEICWERYESDSNHMNGDRPGAQQISTTSICQ